MPSPVGYRKALRLMKQAETFNRAVVCFVDTPGAFCGLEAEERGQGEAIARNLFEMASLTVPVLSIVIGEGGSGGALAMAVANEVWMMENAIYSILSPEGFAAIDLTGHFFRYGGVPDAGRCGVSRGLPLQPGDAGQISDRVYL